MRYFIFCFFFCLHISFCEGQNDIYQGIKKLPISTEEKIRKIDSLLQKNIFDRDTLNLILVSNKFANWHYNGNRVAEALAALSTSIKYHNLDIESLQSKLYKKGVWNNQLENYDSSIIDHKTLIKLDDHTRWATLSYIEIAKNLNHKGDFPLAVENYEIAEERLKKDKNYTKLIYLYTNSFGSYSKVRTTSSLEKLLSNLLAADSLSEIINYKAHDNYNIKRALGSYYINYESRDLKKGFLYLDEALKIALKVKDSVWIAYVYNDLGRLYDDKNPQKSLDYNKIALQYTPKDNLYTRSIIKANLGLNNAHLGNYDQSIAQLQDALKYITGSRFDNISVAVKRNNIKKNLKDDNLWSIIRWLGETYDLKHEKTASQSDLDSAITYYKLTDYTFNQYALKGRLTNSKLLWRKEAAELYSRSIRAFSKANAFEDALEFMEKNKALLLTNETQKLKTFKQEKLPSDLVQREQRLQRELYNFKNKKGVTSQETSSIIDSIEILQEEISRLLPSSSKMNDQFKTVSLIDMQKGLKEDEVVIEYHISVDDGHGIFPNHNIGYGILISKNKASIFELKDLPVLKSLVETFLDKLSSPFSKKDEITSFNVNAHSIYKILFPDKISSEIKRKKITIIPDSYLSQIPFEALIVSDRKESEYLIESNEINYKYSYTFHDSQSKNASNSKNNYVAFAPVNFKETHLSTLNNSFKEIKTIDNYYTGDNYTYDKATKNNFIKQLRDKSIIHLATHANASDSISPWISFNDQKMYLDEISNMQNDASLVVLSACNTTSGEILAGEGVMSLARGFFYGGTRSTLSSLWQIDDKATTYIMAKFYKKLALGETKSSALRSAKLNYIENHNGSETSPYYWSSFILLGDTSSIPKNDWTVYYVIIISIFVMALVFILFSRKRKRQPTPSTY